MYYFKIWRQRVNVCRIKAALKYITWIITWILQQQDFVLLINWLWGSVKYLDSKISLFLSNDWVQVQGWEGSTLRSEIQFDWDAFTNQNMIKAKIFLKMTCLDRCFWNHSIKYCSQMNGRSVGILNGQPLLIFNSVLKQNVTTFHNHKIHQ